MNLQQQIVQDRVQKIAFRNKVSEDYAFMLFVYSLVVDKSVFDIDKADIVDGGQDKQIDIISIEQSEDDEASVYIIQTKNTTSFKSNSLIGMHNGLNWLFNKPRNEISTLSNKAFVDKIYDYRSVQSAVGPSNISVTVVFAANGLESVVSDEFEQEKQSIIAEYDNNTFRDFKFISLGSEGLVELLNKIERQTRRVNVDLKIKYDANNPSLIRYYAQDLKGLVCTCPATEIARIVNEDGQGAIFDLNIRRFLGMRGAVNKDIFGTCTTSKDSYQFWFLNNGITIVCDNFDAVTDPDNPHVKIRNIQIVNGCQTATSLALAQKEGELKNDSRVILRIYETSDKDIINKIVLTTNNQNKISSRDLRANDRIQLDLERGFSIYGFYYERKPRQYDNTDFDPRKIVSNESLAQAYLGVVLRRPSDARRRKYKVWGELYLEVFSVESVEKYLVAYLLSKTVKDYFSNNKFSDNDDIVFRKISKNGLYHIARIVANLWRKGDDWSKQNVLKLQLDQLTSGESAIEDIVKRGFFIFLDIIKSDNNYLQDIDNALKSSSLDKAIDEKLYKPD